MRLRWSLTIGAVVVLLAGCAPAPQASPAAVPKSTSAGGGARPFYAPEAEKFPLAKIARDAGITEQRLAQPKTPADFDKVEENRKVATDGLKTGLQSGQKVPYP